VPEAEAEWVDAFEVVAYPQHIEQPDDNSLLLSYDGDDLGELPEDLAAAVALSKPGLILSYSDLEDHLLLERWNEDIYEIVWDVHEHYEEDYTNSWDTQTLSELKALEDEPKKVLLYLAASLSR